MSDYLHHNKITAGFTVANNLRASGQSSRADFVAQLTEECLRLRQGLWDVAKLCGADTDGNDTPAPLVSDIVAFALDAAQSLREGRDAPAAPAGGENG